MIKIYIANLGKYNEGELVGAWVELPIDTDYLKEVLTEEVGINEEYEEYVIHDYECEFMEISEYSNISKLNEIAEQMENLSEHDIEKLKAIMEWQGGDIEDYIEELDNYNLISGIENDRDYGNYLIETERIQIPEHLLMYIDVEAVGHDYSINWNVGYTNYGLIEKF